MTDDYLGDFLAIELLEGSLFLKYETGGGLNVKKEILLGSNLNDGLQHHIDLFVNEAGTVLVLDSNNCSSNVLCYGETSTSDSAEPSFLPELLIGGYAVNDNAAIFHLETELSLISTISHFYLNHTKVKYTDFTLESCSPGNLRTNDLCVDKQCVNGACIDLWLSSDCTCDNYYEGDLCDLLTTAHLTKESVVSFDSNIYDQIIFESTFQEESGLLFSIVEVRCNIIVILTFTFFLYITDW